MNASEIMSPEFRVLKPSDSLESIVELFKKDETTGFVVVNEDRTVMGVVSPRDLFTENLGMHIPTYLQLLKESKFEKSSDKELPYAAKQLTGATAEDVMNQSVFFAHPDTSLQTIASVFANGKQTVIPVVDQSNKFLGAINIKQIYEHVSEGVVSPEVFDKHVTRPVDQELSYVQKDMSSRFSYIARSKAHVWLTSTMVLFIIGFILGIIFIVDPQPIVNLLQGNLEELLSKIF